MKSYLLVLFLWFAVCLVKAQEITVTGRLFDNEGLEVAGAVIAMKDKQILTISDMEGKYGLSCRIGDILRVSYVGFETQEWVVDGEKKDF